MANNHQVALDPDGLYILLTDLQTPGHFHWSLYLSRGPKIGEIFHAVNDTFTNGAYILESGVARSLIEQIPLLVALKIATIEDVLKPLLRERVLRTPVSDGMTCRSWLMEVLGTLDEEGVIMIKLKSSVTDVENEAKDLARDMEIFKTVAVRQSEHCDI